MPLNNNTNTYYTPRQLKLPLVIEELIDISDPVYTFCDVVENIDLKKYFASEESRTGRPRCDSLKLLKVILFAFMEHGIQSLRDLTKLCRTDIRYMYLLDGMKAPSHATFGKFINCELTDTIEDIFKDINSYIFEKDNVDLNHVYIDGTKIEANANKYTWVWKNASLKNRAKLFIKISELVDQMNNEILNPLGITIEKREEYAIEYAEDILERYSKAANIDVNKFVSGSGKRKTIQQKQYQALEGYIERLKNYATHIAICGNERNSYSKTDKDATFMRLKKDYMGNDQLLPAYNLQAAVCDEYLAVVDVKQYASDMECFVPLMEKFNKVYGHYPKYPVADAGYGSFNNYIYCEEHGMEKYMKFSMFAKETKDKKYQNNPFRADNFKTENGKLICPNGRTFNFKCKVPVKRNRYGRTEEIYVCENCEGCPLKAQCTKSKGNRTIRLNRELTAMHREVIANLECIHGALLRMNRSIQAEGTFGVIKWDRSYKRLFRRGLSGVVLELILIACGFNLYKFHNKLHRNAAAA